jgi:ubiquinone/menaquinone biosynthesis C-methylase UbiE
MAAALAASLGATVSGLDASTALLEIARERTPAADFRQGDLESLPFEDDAFDLVSGFNAFQFAGDAARAARGRARRLAEHELQDLTEHDALATLEPAS